MTAGTPKPQIDTGKPHPARVYDYLLGGKDNYAVDREVGEKMPPDARRGAELNRQFMHRAVAWAAGEGLDQFLDIGTGIPTEPNLHQIAQGVNPASRVVYADNDPIVLRHAEALLVSTPGGTTDYIQADVRDPGSILEHARGCLDFERPVVLSLIALLHFIADEEDAYGVVRTLTDALAPGSHLLFSHVTFEFHPELAERVTGPYGRGGITLRPRNRDEVARFFDGLELVDPGLVTAPEWFRGSPPPAYEKNTVYAGVARVPRR